LIALKFDFVKIVCGYEHFIPLNFPLQSSVEKPFEKVTNIHRDFWERHFLAGWLLNEVSIALDNPSKLVRTKALTVLKDLLAKHEVDPRYNTPEKKARVAGIYFPLFSIVIFLLLLFVILFRDRLLPPPRLAHWSLWSIQ